jgi:hypothetical protein
MPNAVPIFKNVHTILWVWKIFSLNGSNKLRERRTAFGLTMKL